MGNRSLYHIKSEGSEQVRPWFMSTYSPTTHNLSLSYNDTFKVFTNNTDILATIHPIPEPPKGDILYNVQLQTVVEICQDVTCSDQNTVQDIVEALIAKLESSYVNCSQADKVMTLFYWLATHIANHPEYPTSANEYIMYHQLALIQNHKSTPAVLFALMCFYGHVPCVIIKGFVKGKGYYPREKMEKKYTREWNAVLVDGEWRFVDVYWGAGPTVDLLYLFPDPEMLKYTHFTESDLWQLIETPLTKSQFETQAYLRPRFFEMKMTVLNGKEGVNICTEGEIEYQFQLNSTLGFCQEFKCVAKLYEKSIWKIEKLGDINLQMDFIQVIKESEENNTIDDSVEIQNPLTNKQRFILTIQFRFPKIGLYKLEIVGRSLERKEELDFIAIYTVYVNMVHDWIVFFPKVEDIGWGPNPYLHKCGLEAISHKNGEIRCIVDQDLELKLRILPESKTTNITLRYKLREIITNYDKLKLDKEEASKCEKVGEFRPKKNGIIVVKLHIDRLSEMVLNISATLNKTNKGHVINYRIVAEKDPQQLLADFRGKLIEQLSENIKGTDVVQLVQILNTARASGLHRDIQVKDVFKTACTRYVHVKRYRKCINKIARITSNDVAIIRAMHNPDDKLVRIIRTALVVLGEDRHKLDKWERMQPLITLLEPNNLYRRIKKFNTVEAGNKRINMAKTILEDGDLKRIELVKLNQEAAAFGRWLHAVIELTS